MIKKLYHENSLSLGSDTKSFLIERLIEDIEVNEPQTVLYKYHYELFHNFGFMTKLAELYEQEYKLEAAHILLHYETEVFKHIFKKVD